MPSSITCGSTAPTISYTTVPGSPASTASCVTVNSGLNTYTAIKITSVNKNGPDQIANNQIGISGITITGSGWDFYIAAIDSIDGPTYNQTLNSYYLAHAVLKPVGTTGLTASFLNFYNTNSGGLDGSTIPTMLRVTGTTAVTAAAVVVSLTNSVSFFYKNSATREVACTRTCYWPVNPATILLDYDFTPSVKILSYNGEVLIPITLPSGVSTLTLYIQLLNSAGVVLAATTVSSQPSGASLSASIPTAGLTFQISGTTVGGNSFTVTSNYGTAVTAGPASGVTLVSDHDLVKSGAATITGWSQGTCSSFWYVYFSGIVMTPKYGIFCSHTSGTLSPSGFTVSSGSLPSSWGKLIPASLGISSSGLLAALLANTNPATNPATITTVTTPYVGDGLALSTLAWSFLLPVAVSRKALVRLASAGFPLSYSTALGGC
jgi:hypothetical protein